MRPMLTSHQTSEMEIYAENKWDTESWQWFSDTEMEMNTTQVKSLPHNHYNNSDNATASNGNWFTHMKKHMGWENEKETI